MPLRGNSSVLYSNSVMDYHALRGNSSVPYSNSVMDYHALRGEGIAVFLIVFL